MMRPRKRWLLIWIVVPALLLGIVGYLFYHYFFDPTFYKGILEASLSKLLHKEVFIGRANLSLWDGVGFVFEDFHVKDHFSGPDLFYSRRLILKAKLYPLLKGEVRWKRIVLDQPVLHLLRDREGRLNLLGDFVTARKTEVSPQKFVQALSTLFGGSITLKNSEISLSDESLGATPLLTQIKGLHFSLSDVSHGNPFPFRLSGTVVHSNREGRIAMSGTIQNIPEEMNLSRGSLDARVELKGIHAHHFWPYLKSLLPMERLSGTLDMVARYQGDFQGNFKASAHFRLKDVILDYPKVFPEVIRPKWMHIDLTMRYDHPDLMVPLLSIELPELWVKAKGKIYRIGSKQMGLDAEAQTGSFDLSEGKKFIPLRIITRDVSEPLSHSVGNGPVQILSVKLSGKMSEIEHCDQPRYAHLLSAEVKVDGVRLKLPWDLPLLEKFKGHLSYKNGDLQVIETRGRVFHTRIDRANGTFHQLLQTPKLEANLEGQMDLKDLASFLPIKELAADIPDVFSPMKIDSGRADYRLFIKGVLRPPFHFEHQGSYRLWKVRLTHQHIPLTLSIAEGKIDLSNAGVQWSETKVGLGNCSFLMSGSWKKDGGTHPLALTIRGDADVKDLLSLARAPLFSEQVGSRTEWIEELSGKAGFFFKGRGQGGLNFSSYEGEVTPREIHLRPKGTSISVVFKGGALCFSPLGVLFSKFMLYSNHSSLVVDGRITERAVDVTTRGSIDLKDLFSLLQTSICPEPIRIPLKRIEKISGIAEGHGRWTGRRDEGMALLKEGEIQLRELSFKHQEMAAPFSSVEGAVLLSPEQVRITGFQGQIGKSPIFFSGTLSLSPGAQKVSGVQGKHLLFQLHSPSLDFDSFLPKRVGERPLSLEKLGDWLSTWSLQGKVEVEQGRYQDLSFSDLKVEMKTVGEKLVFEPFQFKALGGDLWGEGWIEPIERGVRFEIKPRLSNMEAKAFLRALLQKAEEERTELTGRVHLDRVTLRGEGRDFQRVKESLNGAFRLEVENGMIKRWKILGRIFSILNVSQWFLGRLPDLKTKGLPYHRIVANVHVEGGIVSTEDFVVKSDAIRITLVGRINLVTNQIDATIGVHPLVTIDKILSHLPLAGYILTGEDKAFLSYVYEVKGDLEDPKIEAVPIKGLGQNLWGIIKRLLEIPIRPFKRPTESKEMK
ncbi:MAG: YhdP family protein [Thermodesulfobacteriota bacterium]